MFKAIIEFTKSWKYRNILHVLGGMLISVVPNLIMQDYLGLILGCWLCVIIAHSWEMAQVNHYNAKYSRTDVFLTLIGGLIIGVLLNVKM
jgi:hypothetical protein